MLAVLSDIHGNLPALEAVLADARERGADRFLFLGDYAALGPWPVECVALVESVQPVAMLRGNHERWLTDPSDMPPANERMRAAVDWELEQLGPETVALQAALPATATIDGTLYCHASPGTDMVSFMPAPDPDAPDAELLAGVSAPRVVFGHYHLQFRRTSAEGIELVNPGSVGLPFDGDPRSGYATIADDGTLTLQRVEYDREPTHRALLERGAWGEWIADCVARAAP